MKALPLAQLLHETKIPAKDRFAVICSVVGLYNAPFSMELVEELFDFPDTVVGDNWEDWKTNGDKYSLDESVGQLPTPQTIGEFIDDCNRVWNRDLVFYGDILKPNVTYDQTPEK